MNKIHFYFFCLYNLFYKDGFGLQDKITYRGLPIEQRPIFLLCLSTWFWTIVIRLVVIVFFNPIHKIVLIKNFEFVIPAVSFGAFYFYFINNNRYIDLNAEYRLTDKCIQRQTVKKVIFFLALPILLIPILAYMIATQG
jgi:hypothetical protein